MASNKKTDIFENIMVTREGVWVQGKDGDQKVCNFGLKILFRIQSAYGDISWLIAIMPPDSDDLTISLSNKEFATPAAFHEALLRYGFVFRGEKSALNMIKEDLIPKAEQAEAISSLGYHAGSGLFFFVNGAQAPGGAFIVPDEFGMIRHEKNAYFLPFAQDLDNKNFKTFARMNYQPGEQNLDSWLKMIADAHGKKSLIPACFRLAAYFRDIAFQHVHFFPLLYLRGVPGAGKSTCARSMTATDGRPQEDLNLKSPNTTKSIPRRLEQISNSIVWFDEYANELNEGVLGTLQAAYDGGGYQRAVNGFSNMTNSIEIHSALILTSNYTPDTEFMRQRCVFITFSDSKKSEQQREAFNRLTGCEIGNLSSVGADMLAFRRLIEIEWKKTHKELYQGFIKALPGVESRICNNIAVILTPARILERKRLVDFQEIFKLKETLIETGKAVCLAQQEILTGKSDLSQFFEVLAYCAERRIIREGEDYRYSKDGKTLSIRISRVYPLYLREFRSMFNKVGASREDLLNEIKRHPSFKRPDDDKKIESNERFDVPGSNGERQSIYLAIKFDAAKFAESFPLTLRRDDDEQGEA